MSISAHLGDRQARMVLATLIEPGDADLTDLLDEVGAAASVERLRAGEVGERLRRLTAGVLASGPNPTERAAALDRATDACGARVLIPGDPEWPRQVADLDRLGLDGEPHLRAPWCLWVRGKADLAMASANSVAVIGSHAATEYGRHLAAHLASGLAESGRAVVSHGGFGIATAAHTGALAGGGATIAVLSGGLGRLHPTTNGPLFDSIIESGALVSEQPPGADSMRFRMFARNRLVAALAAGTVVVEAGLRSGARNGARYAHELGRVLMFTPGPVTSSQSEGVHQLARAGWGARLVTSAAEVIDDLEIGAGEVPACSRSEAGRSFAQLSPTEQVLVEAMPRGFWFDTARIAAAAGVPAERAAAALDSLRESGWVEQVNDRWRLTAVEFHG